MRIRMVASVAAMLAAAGLLAGCGAAASGAEATPVKIDVEASWIDGGRLIGVITWGSTTCVPRAEEATLGADGALEVTLQDPPADGACTADFQPRVSLVGVPDGVDPAKDLKINVLLGGATGGTTLAGVEGLAGPGTGSDSQPSAAWASIPNTLVYLTWGSSSCVPIAENIEATGDSQLTLTFAEPDPARACTMDLVPRVRIIEVPALTTPAGAQLVLTGDTYDNVQVAIIGAPA